MDKKRKKKQKQKPKKKNYVETKIQMARTTTPNDGQQLVNKLQWTDEGDVSTEQRRILQLSWLVSLTNVCLVLVQHCRSIHDRPLKRPTHPSY